MDWNFLYYFENPFIPRTLKNRRQYLKVRYFPFVHEMFSYGRPWNSWPTPSGTVTSHTREDTVLGMTNATFHKSVVNDSSECSWFGSSGTMTSSQSKNQFRLRRAGTLLSNAECVWHVVVRVVV